MDSKATVRLALTIAAAVALAALTAKSLHACDSTNGCQTGNSSLAGLFSTLTGIGASPAPTNPEATEEKVEAPMALKKFTKPQSRAARRAQSRKAVTSRDARKNKAASHKAEQDQDAEASARAKEKDQTIDPALANAKAELVAPEAGNTKAAAPAGPAETSPAAQLPAAIPLAVGAAAAPPSPAVELVSADEFNELDRAAWEKNQLPKLMQLTASDSRAELRADDSTWAQTSMIGKVFVAFGALLTIGSALRMLLA